VQIPDKKLDKISAYLRERYAFELTHADIQALADEFGQSEGIARYWPDTEERENLLDALAVKWAGRHWPLNMEADDPTFARRLVEGYHAWKTRGSDGGAG
jgi:hypothetical protein